MSSPACFAIIEGGHCHACYGRGAAEDMHRTLFWGPEDALGRIDEWTGWKEQYDDGTHPSLNWGYDEAACLIDLDRRLLVLYFSTDVSYEMPLLEAYLRLLRYTWPRWDVRWAWREFWDVARYAGCSSEDLDAIKQCYQRNYPPAYNMDYVMEHLFDHSDCEDTTLSYTKGGLTRIQVIDLSMPECLLGRREELEMALKSLLEPQVSLDYVPFSGLHLDYDRHEVHRWGTWGNERDVVESGWDGWAIIDHKADYRMFLRVLGNAINIESRPEKEYISRLHSHYVETDPYDDWPESKDERSARFDEIERQYLIDNPIPIMVPTDRLLGITWA